MYLKLQVNDETSRLDAVLLGIGTEPGGPGSLNPKAEFHLEQGSYPAWEDIRSALHELEATLLEHGVKVFRPRNIARRTQVFARDLGFVIEDEFFLSSMSDGRLKEQDGIRYLTELMDPSKVINLGTHEDIRIEGGDVVLMQDAIYLGLSDRTNQAAYEYLKKYFSRRKKVVQVKLVTDKNDHWEHSLHLDCVFQPLGNKHAIIFEDGIHKPSGLYEQLALPRENIFKADRRHFLCMVPNVLSINPETVVIEKEFVELQYWLQDRGFKVVPVNFREVSKLGGLLRCVTLPLCRFGAGPGG